VSSPLAVGISYAVLSYATAALSGGQLNPVVTLAQALSGHTHFVTAGLYITAQVKCLSEYVPGYLHVNQAIESAGCYQTHQSSPH